MNYAENRKKVSDAQLGEKNHRYGKHLSEKERIERSILNGGKGPFVCNETGQIFKTLHEGEKILNIKNIGKVLCGRYKHAGGYTFKYIDETNNTKSKRKRKRKKK